MKKVATKRRKWFALKDFDLKKLKSHHRTITYTIKDGEGNQIKNTRFDAFEKCFYWRDGEEAVYIDDKGVFGAEMILL